LRVANSCSRRLCASEIRLEVSRSRLTSLPRSETESALLTLVPYMSDQAIQFLENRDGTVNIREQIRQENALELRTFGIGPVMAGLVPFAGQRAGGTEHDFGIGANVHDGELE